MARHVRRQEQGRGIETRTHTAGQRRGGQSFGGGADHTFGICRKCGQVCGLEVTVVSLDGDLSTRTYGFPGPLMSGASPRQRPTLSSDDIVVPPYVPAPADALFRQGMVAVPHGRVRRFGPGSSPLFGKRLQQCSDDLRRIARRQSEEHVQLVRVLATARQVGQAADGDERHPVCPQTISFESPDQGGVLPLAMCAASVWVGG